MNPSVLDNIQQLRRFSLRTAQKPDKPAIHLPLNNSINDRKATVLCQIKKETKLFVQRPHIVITNKKTCARHIFSILFSIKQCASYSITPINKPSGIQPEASLL